MNHREIIELLPWYANASLDEQERKIVETHLAGCRECTSELESLATMQKIVIEAGNQVPAPSPTALNRALAAIENYEQDKAQAPTQQRGQFSGLREQIANFWRRWWQPAPLLARSLIAAQAVLLVALGTIALYQHQHPNIVYITSSGPGPDRTTTAIVVGFNSGASEQEIRETILSVHGKIIDGPSALNLYTIQVPVPRDQTAEIDQLLKTLRENVRVVRLAGQKQ